MELCEATEENPFIHGMSSQFVQALQQLFEVLDTDQSGTIRYFDLASQWEEDTTDPYFPKGLVACLAKVTLPNGLLTFDRFCAGIKLCLLKNQVDLNDLRNGTNCNGSAIDDSCSSTVFSELNQNLAKPPSQREPRSVDRPPSEPRIHAPPPPATSSNPNSTSIYNEINNNVFSATNKNVRQVNGADHAAPPTSSAIDASQPSTSNYPLANTNMVPNGPVSPPSTFGNTHSSPSKSSTCSAKLKKLPLPTYEQVMAIKSKPLAQIPTNNNQSQVSLGNCIPHRAQHTQSGTVYPVNGFHTKPFNDAQMLAPNGIHFKPNDAPNVAFQQQQFHPDRSRSMIHLNQIANQMSGQPHVNTAFDGQNMLALNQPPKSVSSANLPKTLSRNCIMKTLQTWREILSHKFINDFSDLKIKSPSDSSMTKANETIENGLTINSLKRTANASKRREPRRHTVGSNGIDLYSVLAIYAISLQF